MNTENKPPSDEFVKAFSASNGGIRRECEWCGRTCFEDDEHAGDWENGELEELREKAKTDPEHYVAMDRVSMGRVDGKDFVMGCPCLAEKISRYENFIWVYRRQINEYLQKRIKSIVEQALQDEADLEHTKDSLEQENKIEEKVTCKYCHREVRKIGFDEGNERCHRCTAELERLHELIMDEQDYSLFAEMRDKIKNLGGTPPSFIGELPF